MILSSQTQDTDAEQMLAFYMQHFLSVELVSCSSCGANLAFECAGGDGMGMQPNELGKFVIPIGTNLLSSRVRLDETSEGERMMGYQCGALIPNPVYATKKAEHDANIAKLQADHKKAVAAAEKKNAALAGGEDPVTVPALILPSFNVPAEIACGNDTRISEVERGAVPVGAGQVTLTPFERHRIREQIKEMKVKPDFRRVGNTKHFETFQVERIK